MRVVSKLSLRYLGRHRGLVPVTASLSWPRHGWSGQWHRGWMSLAIAALVIKLYLATSSMSSESRPTSAPRCAASSPPPARCSICWFPTKCRSHRASLSARRFCPRPREVGGDFYLCRALPNGAQRVLLGDVSGKGVAAALTSALLLGAADRCGDLRPAAVLKELNAALRNSGIEGFTTCLCADLSASGVLLIANAGQLPPYRKRARGDRDSFAGLPLRRWKRPSRYAETSLELAPGEQAHVCLSDGVVEARNALGELFGFERTRQLSSRAAQQIADAAVKFGQQDDITVLTLSLAARPAAA